MLLQKLGIAAPEGAGVDYEKFTVGDLKEATVIASYLASLYPDPESAFIGVHELIVNAVEHGNLEIGYEKKSELIENNLWAEEIERRMAMPHNESKEVEIRLYRCASSIKLYIKDQGKGFQWQEYLDISSERAADKHGRGIALSNIISFDSLHYIGNGSEVCCVVGAV